MTVWRTRTNEVGVPGGHNYREVLQRHVTAPPLTQQRWRRSVRSTLFFCVPPDELSDLIIDWDVIQELRMCFQTKPALFKNVFLQTGNTEESKTK